jgi:2-dehydro-3-deoxyphosphogluconate aldolase / (4S)-4-hydroxy-2-oxoglutarate aldolase
MSILQQILQHKIIAIIRGANPVEVLPIVQALYDGGVRAVEITLNSQDALHQVQQVAQQFTNKMLVGAGTVLDATAAAQAIDAGAQFIIAPSVDVATIKLTKQRGVISIPGAYTATEVVTAHHAGADIIKLFPASDPQYLKALKGPLDQILMMPTGGVNLHNIQAFQKAGAAAFGIASALVDTSQPITPGYLQALTQKSQQFIAAVNP